MLLKGTKCHPVFFCPTQSTYKKIPSNIFLNVPCKRIYISRYRSALKYDYTNRHCCVEQKRWIDISKEERSSRSFRESFVLSIECDKSENQITCGCTLPHFRAFVSGMPPSFFSFYMLRHSCAALFVSLLFRFHFHCSCMVMLCLPM